MPDPIDWHLLEAEDIARRHEVSIEQGLHEADAASRRMRHGSNLIAASGGTSAWRLLLRQFSDFMILVLIAAAAVSALLREWTDSLAIVVIVVLNGLVGFTQAWRADRALAALKKLAPQQATVVRQGRARRVQAHELVPGDVVLIEAGDQVPADLRLAHVARLLVDESALTGESEAVEKHAQALRHQASALGDRRNMAYKGTLVAEGTARALVVATGMGTELGKVARLMTGTGSQQTPLQRRLADLGRRLALAVLAVCAVVFVAGLMRAEPVIPMMLTAISLAVAAIPEALPAVVTVLLALGARRMASLNALVRQLPSVETLGSVTFICSDKTGTLTQNRMRVEALQAGCPDRELLRALVLCNDAAVSDGGFVGDPTETALLSAAQGDAIDVGESRRRHPRLFELPFDSQRKRMTTLHRVGGVIVGFTKGAPEAVLPRCVSRLTPQGEGAAIDIGELLATAEDMASRGLRVLAVATRTHATLPSAEAEALESGLAFMGLVGLIDPPRREAAEAVRSCLRAGITPVMITGDHPGTALAIARRIGIVPEAPPAGTVVTGVELASLSDGALRDVVRQARVYARVDPAQKIRIVQALQAQGEFVAMTGDGVNDAPALKQADVGVAMGRAGTDVARESASLVLLDDNFASIVGAVREGRRIYDNIRKFVRYAMTGNSGEVWTIFLAPLVGLPIPLLPIHILWVNLVTDGLPGIALAGEPAERGVMQRPPRPPQESLFDNGLWQHVLFVGLLIGGLCLSVQGWALVHAPQQAQTMVFTTLTLTQMAHVLGIRSERDSLWRTGLLSNLPLLGAVLLTVALQVAVVYLPLAQPWFKTVPLSALELGLCGAAAGVVLAVVEAEKAWRRSRVSAAAVVPSPAHRSPGSPPA